MTTIVKHKRTGNEYILLGINGEGSQANPSRFISEFFAQEKPELSCSATVCDAQGNIFLAYIDDLNIIEIDGKRPADILPEPSFESVQQDVYQRSELKDEDLLEEDFEDEEDDPIEPQTASGYSQAVYRPKTSMPERDRDPNQIPSNQNDFDDDDEDWI